MFENFHLRQQLDTIVDPHNKHTIEDQGCSWTTPLKNCLAAVIFLLGYKASYILGNWAFVRNRNEIKKVKEKTLAKEQDKRNV